MNDDQGHLPFQYTYLPNDSEFERAVERRILNAEEWPGLSHRQLGMIVVGVGLVAILFTFITSVVAWFRTDKFETPEGLATLIAVAVVMGAFIWWSNKKTSVVKLIAQSGRELALERSEKKRAEIRKAFATTQHKDVDFIEVASHNNLSMTVADGEGNKTGSVIIEVTWHCGDRFNPTLHLWRSLGPIQTDINELRQLPRTRARGLGEKKHAEKIQFHDIEITSGTTYYYYAWIEVELYGERLLIASQNRSHVVVDHVALLERKRRETEAEGELKRKQWEAEEEKQRRHIDSNPILKNAIDEVAQTKKVTDDAKQAFDVLEKVIDKSTTDPDDKDRYLAKGESTIARAMREAEKKKPH